MSATNDSAANSSDLIGSSQQSNDDIALIVTVLAMRYLICMVGLPANILVCVAISRYRNLHNVGNYFVFNLAIVDALALLYDMIMLPVTVMPAHLGNKFESLEFLQSLEPPCDIEMGGNTLVIISALFLVVIATDRYIYIEYPLSYHPYIEQTYKIQIILVWLLPGIFCSFLFHFTVCSSRSDLIMVFQYTQVMILLVCFVVMAIQYTVILNTAYVQFKRSRQAMQYTNTNKGPDTPTVQSIPQPSHAQQVPVRMIVGFVIIVGMAFLSLVALPGTFYLLLRMGLHNTHYTQVKLFKYFLGIQMTLNNACNPVIYGFTQKKYRDAFVGILGSIFIQERESDALDLDVTETEKVFCCCVPIKSLPGHESSFNRRNTINDVTTTNA